MSRIKLLSICAALFVVTTCVAQVVAQAQAQGGRRQGGFGGFGMGGPLQIVSNEAVQKELGIKDEQAAKIKAMNEEIRNEMAAAIGGGGAQDFTQLSEEERAKLRTKMGEVSKKINDTYSPKLKELLDTQQRERLQQITWQAAGVQAIQDPVLVAELKINKEQTEKLIAISKEFSEKQQQLFAGGGAGGDAQERFAKIREATEARDKAALEVLTAEQREQFEKLKGKPFDVAQLRPRGNFGGGRKAGDRPQRPGQEKKEGDK